MAAQGLGTRLAFRMFPAPATDLASLPRHPRLGAVDSDVPMTELSPQSYSQDEMNEPQW